MQKGSEGRQVAVNIAHHKHSMSVVQSSLQVGLKRSPRSDGPSGRFNLQLKLFTEEVCPSNISCLNPYIFFPP